MVESVVGLSARAYGGAILRVGRSSLARGSLC